MSRALSGELATLAREHTDLALGVLVGIATTGTSDAARVQATAALAVRGIARPLILRLAITTLIGRSTADQHLLLRGEAEERAALPDVGEITNRLRPLAASLFAERGDPDGWDDRAEYSAAEYALLMQFYEEWKTACGTIGENGVRR